MSSPNENWYEQDHRGAKQGISVKPDFKEFRIAAITMTRHPDRRIVSATDSSGCSRSGGLDGDLNSLQPYAQQFDFLILTAPTNVPTHPITNMLLLGATYVIVGARELIEDVLDRACGCSARRFPTSNLSAQIR